MVFSGGRMRELPRLFRRGRGPRRSGATRRDRRRCLCRRRSRVFDARLFQRSHVVDGHPLSRYGGRASDLPRARASGCVCEGRHGVQRILRRGGRGGGDWPLARGAGRCRADGAIQYQPTLSRRISHTCLSHPERAGDALCKSRQRRREACRQGRRLCIDACRLRCVKEGMGWLCRL